MKKLPIPHKEIYAVPVRSFSEFTFGTSELFAWKNTRFITNLDGVRGVFHIHGTVDANTIDFDAAQVVPKEHGMLNNVYALRHYISAADVWFFNPTPDPGVCCGRCIDGLDECNSEDREAWQAAQNNVVEKVVIIEKVK